MFNVAQVWIAVTGLLAIYLVSRKSKYAPFWGLIGQPAWFYSAIYTKQYGIFALSVAYSVMWGLTAYKWQTIEKHAFNRNKTR